MGAVSSRLGGPSAEDLIKQLINSKFKKVEDIMEGKEDIVVEKTDIVAKVSDNDKKLAENGIDQDLIDRSKSPFLILAKCMMKEGLSLEDIKKLLVKKAFEKN